MSPMVGKAAIIKKEFEKKIIKLSLALIKSAVMTTVGKMIFFFFFLFFLSFEK